MSVFEIKDGLFFWIYFMTWANIVSPDCSTDQMAFGGGWAYRNGNLKPNNRFGCTNDCPTNEPEIHVIAQFGPKSSKKGVSIALNNSCENPVDVILVLISEEGIKWKLEYGDKLYDDGDDWDDVDDWDSAISTKVNIKEVLVYKAQGSQTQSSVEDFDWKDKGGFPFTMPNNTRDSAELMALQYWATANYKVTSINFGITPIKWELDIHYDCCQGKQPESPITATHFPLSTHSAFLTSSTKPAGVPQSDSQGSGEEPQTIAIVVVVVILTVILIIVVIVGTLWYYHRQRKQTELNDHQGQESVNQGLSSLARGAAVHVEPNMYTISPTVDHSESQGIIREQTMLHSSALPLPSRANRP